MIKVGILGATGIVGQRFVSLLHDHPYFDLVVLGASVSSAGKQYKDIVKWRISNSIPFSTLLVKECIPENFQECMCVFSALDSSVATEIEDLFAKQGIRVFSNAKNYRMHSKVPLVIPLANPGDMFKTSNNMIITNSNCTTTGVAVILKALSESFPPLDKVLLVSMQGASGAGLAGVSYLDLCDNVIPYIEGEEEKISMELKKILGHYDENLKEFLNNDALLISASCNRVPVMDGHLVSLSFSFSRECKPCIEEMKECLKQWTPLTSDLPHRPKQAIHVFEEIDRPQPRLDRNLEDGFAVCVGRIRECEAIKGYSMSILIHNTIIGAAGSSLLNAEAFYHEQHCQNLNY